VGVAGTYPYDPMREAPKTLVTFDVDGTLIHSVGNNANKFHKDAFAFAFKKVFNLGI
jgi:FMN phosphatase YigB (HAD superfamily)